jgi:hypothetical protein
MKIKSENHPERKTMMLGQALNYARYALATLATLGFGLNYN